jgi:hypothetical protein
VIRGRGFSRRIGGGIAETIVPKRKRNRWKFLHGQWQLPNFGAKPQSVAEKIL